MSGVIANLPLPCGPVIGGIRQLQIIAIEDVLSIPEDINSVVTSEIVLRSGAEVAVIEFPSSGCLFTENQKDTDAGSVKNPKITLQIPKDAPELGDWANKHDDREVIALYLDRNNTAVIVGDLNRPLLVNLNRTTGGRPTDKNQFEMTLEGISDHYAYYYMMFEKKTPGNRRVYTAGYTFGYQRT